MNTPATIEYRFRSKDGLEATEVVEGRLPAPAELKRVLTVPLSRAFLPGEPIGVETRKYRLVRTKESDIVVGVVEALYVEV